MTRERWAQVITVAMLVLGAIGTGTHLFPEHVSEWALWASGLVAAIASALGFNTGNQPSRDGLRLAKRTPPHLLLLLCLPLMGACGAAQTGSESPRTALVSSTLDLAAEVVRSVNAAYLERFDADDRCEGDEQCRKRYLRLGYALVGARGAVNAAHYSLLVADDSRESMERLACAAAAVGSLLEAASEVGAVPQRELLAEWAGYASSLGQAGCRDPAAGPLPDTPQPTGA